MRVLFLDIDGVLNSEESFRDNHALALADMKRRNDVRPFNMAEIQEFSREFFWPLGHLYEPLIERLNKIVELTDCKIVISSTWRKFSTPQEIAGYLKLKGFKYPDSIIDQTCILNLTMEEFCRGREIEKWLNDHSGLVTRYAILDDDCADIEAVHPDNLVKTTFEQGLQDKHVELVVNILNRKRE